MRCETPRLITRITLLFYLLEPNLVSFIGLVYYLRSGLAHF